MTVDDDAEVLGAIERDLRTRYADRYRVLRSASGATALDALRGLKKRNDSVGLLLVDQRMPEMTGVEFLGQSMEIYPNAKRVLLTAYAETDAAIRAINDARIHHYLLKPWDPPEEHHYPVLDDLLHEGHDRRLHAGYQSAEARGAKQAGKDGPEKGSFSGLTGPNWTIKKNGSFAEVLWDVGVPDGI